MFIEPPVTAAALRAMSRPSPEEPVLLPRDRARSGSGMPGPASSTTSSTAWAVRTTLTPNGVPGGVWRKTLPMSASTTAATSSSERLTAAGSWVSSREQGRLCCSARTAQKAVRRRTTSAASQRGPAAPAPVAWWPVPASVPSMPWPMGPTASGVRAAVMMAWSSVSSSLTAASTLADSGDPAIRSDARCSAVSGVRSRWDRSATSSRSTASSSVIRWAMALKATPASRSSLGPMGSTRASRLPSPSAWEAWASLLEDLTTFAPRRSATSTEPPIRPTARRSMTAQEVLTPRVSSSSGTKFSMTATRSPGSTTGCRQIQPLGICWEMDSRPFWARSSSAAGARELPRAGASGRCTTRCSVASRLAADSRRADGSVVSVSTGARAAARCSAAVTLCSLTSDITSAASGMRKERATIDVTASATPASERLNAAPPV